jgi:YjbE family integral membrane protein
MFDFITAEALRAFLEVVVIDLTLAGDNAVVIGMAAAGLPRAQRIKAIFIGIVVATVLRIAFALVAVQLLEIVGLLLAGGFLLLWVCYNLWRELQTAIPDVDSDALAEAPQKSLAAAVTQIVVADVSMSLDNVLAVAGAARDHPTVLIFGLGLSILLMGLLSGLIAQLLHKHRWIAYFGLAIILLVALRMVWEGAGEVLIAAT